MQYLRDAFELRTWVAVGAVLQSLLLAVLPIQWAIVPAAFYLFTRIIDTVLVWNNWKENPHMAGVINGKSTAQFPGSTAPSKEPIVVIQLAARSNHALGSFHPWFKKIGDLFDAMIVDLEERSEEFGYLGSKVYLAVERPTANEVMTVVYFRNYEGMHKFSHEAGGIHREAWHFWNTVVNGPNSKIGHLFGIMHEAYEVPAQHWETIYGNYNPTGLGATTFRVEGKDGKVQWASPMMDANRGPLRTSKGRRATTKSDDNDSYEKASYA